MKRIVLAAIGSYGDINPSLAIGRELKARGHAVVLAAPELFAEDAAREGLEFKALRLPGDPSDPEFMTRVLDARRGSEFVVRDLTAPAVRDTYEDLEAAAEGADVLVSHILTFAAPVLAEKKGLPWLSTALQPVVFFSAYDPPVLAPMPWLAALRPLGPGFNGVLLRALKRVTRSWSEPVRQLRRDLGLPEGGDPLFEGQHSPYGVLALFSSEFGAPQPDWPANVRVCGFPFYDQDFDGKGLDAGLAAFLGEGEAPLLFTLGSSAVVLAREFFRHAAQAARRLGRRALLLAGANADALTDLPAGVRAARSAPYHAVFPRCAAIVHPGGVGTTAQALRSGRPQLIVPFAHDQFDNAARVERLGAGRVIRRAAADEARLERALGDLLADSAVSEKAASAARIVAGENGVAAACDEIEAVLRGRRPAPQGPLSRLAVRKHR